MDYLNIIANKMSKENFKAHFIAKWSCFWILQPNRDKLNLAFERELNKLIEMYLNDQKKNETPTI
jgi:hypothetical protein